MNTSQTQSSEKSVSMFLPCPPESKPIHTLLLLIPQNSILYYSLVELCLGYNYSTLGMSREGGIMARDKAICRNCESIAIPQKRGSLGLEIVLWLVFFPVGICYSSYRSTLCCRSCRSIDILSFDSPKGQQLYRRSKYFTQNKSEKDFEIWMEKNGLYDELK